VLTLRYVVVDVFTDRPLAGNPLAVFTDARGLSQDTMQALACELNLSETTFVLPAEAGGTARVRIFTPRAEIPFAGHPTLGTALVLGTPLEGRTLTLELPVGKVPVVLEREGARVVGGWFSRPAPPPLAFAQGEALLAALGLRQTASPLTVYDNGMRHALVHLATHAEVAELQPDLEAVSRVPVDTVDVVAWDGEEALLRVFAPAHGVYEDPATGSAAAPVFRHLVEHAGLDPRSTLPIRQGEHLRRPSLIDVRQSSDSTDASPQIEVGGRGVVVARGEFRLPGVQGR
jgi:trans-2,3-dihydro-3-hydroxyanthranilate isomerase